MHCILLLATITYSIRSVTSLMYTVCSVIRIVITSSVMLFFFIFFFFILIAQLILRMCTSYVQLAAVDGIFSICNQFERFKFFFTFFLNLCFILFYPFSLISPFVLSRSICCCYPLIILFAFTPVCEYLFTPVREYSVFSLLRFVSLLFMIPMLVSSLSLSLSLLYFLVVLFLFLIRFHTCSRIFTPTSLI